MPTYTFDPSRDDVPQSQQEAETSALEAGERLAQQNAEDRDRKMAQVRDEQPEDLIGGKFKSQEDLLKAYNELQAKLGSKSQEEEGDASEEPVEASEETTTEEEEVEVTEARRAVDRAADVFNSQGELTSDTIEELSQLDSKELISAYMDYYHQTAQQAQSQAVAADQEAAIQQIAGGPDQYGELMQWSAQNLASDEVEAFNNVVNSGNIPAIRFAVEALSNRYRSSEGYEAPLVTGRKAAPQAKGYRSNAELARDIADPRYNSDPAFRADVEAKLARSGDLL